MRFPLYIEQCVCMIFEALIITSFNVFFNQVAFYCDAINLIYS